jgi:hypothetical protein
MNYVGYLESNVRWAVSKESIKKKNYSIKKYVHA